MAIQPEGRRKWWMGAGIAACLAGGVILARIPYFYLHSYVRGQQLLRQAQQAVGAGNQANPAVRQTGGSTQVPLTTVNLMKPAQPGAVLGTLSIPALHLTAPVLQGTQDVQLNVSVGHLTTSVMPGQRGTTILAAHNATWFRHLNQLQPGEPITVQVPGASYTFAVTSHQVVRTGAPVYNTSTPTLVLEACYPLDALYLTPYRYLVFAKLVNVGSRDSGAARQTAASTADMTSLMTRETGKYTASVPTNLAKQGLTLSTNSLPMGKLTYTGTPSLTYTESNQPLSASSTLVALYLAWLHASSKSSAPDLSALLPTVQGAHVSTNPAYGLPLTSIHYRSQFDVTLAVQQDALTKATGLDTVQLGQRGTYRVTVLATAHGNQLQLNSIQWVRL